MVVGELVSATPDAEGSERLLDFDGSGEQKRPRQL